MLKIKLTGGYETIVDDEDYGWLSQHKWHLHKDGYAYRSNGNKNIYMHRLVNCTPPGLITDHINQNKLDNRKSNLRTVVKSQNQRNTKMFATNTSGYKGVSWSKIMEKWEAYLWKNNKKINLGYFNEIERAARARQKGEMEHWTW